MAWFIYRIQTQTGINPLDLRRDGKRSRGEKLEMIEGGKKKPFMIAGKINTSLSCYTIYNALNHIDGYDEVNRITELA